MTVDSTRRADPAALAAVARSVMACPYDVQLVVEGIDDISAGLDADGEEPGLDLRDIDGRPVFTCPADAQLARAAAEGRRALVTVTSGLGAPKSPARDVVVTLTGRLAVADREECPCCDRVQDTVCLEIEDVLLRRTGPAGSQVQHRVPLAAYTSPDHLLNRGFLQRSVEHANSCHQDELRRALSMMTGTRMREVVGVHLVDLRPDQVEVRWVDTSGAHCRTLEFGRAATTAAELGELLRDHLHANMC